MGKKKITFGELVELRKNDKEQFLKTVLDEFQSSAAFDGEVCVKDYVETKKDGKTTTALVDKWFYFTDEEKRALVDMVKSRVDKMKEEILKECRERSKRAEGHEYLGLYENGLVSSAICEALEDKQRIPEWLFVKACRLFEKHIENEDVLWKSYLFKGFIRWEQIERAMRVRERSDSKSE